MLLNKLKKRLDRQRSEKLWRQVDYRTGPQSIRLNYEPKKQYLGFCSNDYLGLANDPRLIATYKEAIDQYGIGSGASVLLSGATQAHRLLQETIAEFTGYPDALIFSTGYMANLSVISTLSQRKDTVLLDRQNHTSLIEGARLSQATLKRYRHQDLQHLEQLLQRAPNTHRFIITDGVFSTTGRLAKLPDLASMAKKYGAYLMIDDAHGLGCLGKKGKGCLEYFGLSHQDVPILVGTFGKAFGSFGAFVASNPTIIQTLKQFAKPYIYTTALPPALVAVTQKSFEIARQEHWRRDKLNTLIQYFQNSAKTRHLPVLPSQTPIQSLLIGQAKKAIQICDQLLAHGLLIKALRPPTVTFERDTVLRVTLSASHEHKHIDKLLDALEQYINPYRKIE